MVAVALGTVVFHRTEKLRRLLRSVEGTCVSKVYVADNGDSADRTHVYEQSYPFELEVLDLEFDVGIGASRRAVADACDEEYLLVVDSDMTVPHNVATLVDQLEAMPGLGGVSGVLREDGVVHSGYCHDLFEEETYKGTVLVGGIREKKDVWTVDGSPLVPFDFVINATLFRTRCLDDYAWTSDLKHQAHEDFFVGHMKRTDWTFGACAEVVFDHDPGGGDDYEENYRFNKQRLARYVDSFLDRWGYEEMIYEPGRYWISSYEPKSRGEVLRRFLKDALATRHRVALFDAVEYLRGLRRDDDEVVRESVPEPRS